MPVSRNLSAFTLIGNSRSFVTLSNSLRASSSVLILVPGTVIGFKRYDLNNVAIMATIST